MIQLPLERSFLPSGTRGTERNSKITRGDKKSPFLFSKPTLSSDILYPASDPDSLVAFDKLYFGDLEGFLCLNDVLKHFGLPPICDLFTPKPPRPLCVPDGCSRDRAGATTAPPGYPRRSPGSALLRK